MLVEGGTQTGSGEDGISSCRGNQAVLGLSLVFSQGSDLKPGVSL